MGNSFTHISIPFLKNLTLANIGVEKSVPDQALYAANAVTVWHGSAF